MARRKSRGRPINGLLLLNKPVGETSNRSLQTVKNLYQAVKAGHTGSLDPLASGMLPICFGEATKFSQFLLEADKAYRVTGKFGERTETADADGAVIEVREVTVSKRQLSHALEAFRGRIQQIPSMYSALKHNGQPLYKLARQGIEVEREPRDVTIFELHLLSFESPYFVLDVECSKGTYIRNLVEDLGEALGCGAHVTELHRHWAGPFDPEEMVTLEKLLELAETGDLAGLDALLLPTESPVSDLPSVDLNQDMADFMLHGQPVLVPRAPTQGVVRLYDATQHFIGVGEVLADGRIAPKRLIATGT